MSSRFWGGAVAVKVGAGLVMALVASVLTDVLSRKWPTGGAR
jgi:hypothetical protein